MAEQTLIDRGFLEKLERLTIRWQKSFPGLVGGRHPSRHSGPGQEFLDHRHFHHGDDLRSVNWRAYLRFEKLFMKMFHVEPRIPVRLLLDVSGSMATGDGAKLFYARKLAAALSYVGLVRLDTITLLPFDQRLGDAHICSGGRHRFAPAVEFLTGLGTGQETRFLEVVRQFTGRYLQRGLLIIISDFLDEEGCERPLQFLADFGHELMLVQIWDDEDRSPPWYGELELEDAETGVLKRIDYDEEARDRHTAAFDEYASRLQRVALGSGGRYVGLSTKVKVEDAIFGPLVSAVGG